jgi:hypothetical protein
MWPHFNPTHVCPLPPPSAQVDHRLSRVLPSQNMSIPDLNWVRMTYPNLSLPPIGSNNSQASISAAAAAAPRTRRPKAPRPSSSANVPNCRTGSNAAANSSGQQAPVVANTAASSSNQQTPVAPWYIPPFPPEIQGGWRRLLDSVAMPMNMDAINDPFTAGDYPSQGGGSMEMGFAGANTDEYLDTPSFQRYPDLGSMDLGAGAVYSNMESIGPQTLSGATQQPSMLQNHARPQFFLNDDFLDSMLPQFTPNPHVLAPRSSRPSTALSRTSMQTNKVATPSKWNDLALDTNHTLKTELLNSPLDVPIPQAESLVFKGDSFSMLHQGDSTFQNDGSFLGGHEYRLGRLERMNSDDNQTEKLIGNDRGCGNFPRSGIDPSTLFGKHDQSFGGTDHERQVEAFERVFGRRAGVEHPIGHQNTLKSRNHRLDSRDSQSFGEFRAQSDAFRPRVNESYIAVQDEDYGRRFPGACNSSGQKRKTTDAFSEDSAPKRHMHDGRGANFGG